MYSLKQKIADAYLNKSPWDDFEDMCKSKKNIFNNYKKGQFDFFKNFKFDFNKNTIFIIIIIFTFSWLISGIYEVKEGEEAAVIRFGRFSRKGTAGLNYHIPKPFETVIIEKVNQSRRIEIGYRSIGNGYNNENVKIIQSESIMLSGDENILVLNCDVMWHINDLEKFIFRLANNPETVKAAAESAIREVIGAIQISSILSDKKQQITYDIEILTQKILNDYDTGITIEKIQLLKAEPPAEVIESYRDVQTAKADKEREINQAQAYNNDVLPKARGEAEKIIQAGEGYRQEIILKAEGEAKRFLDVYEQYSLNKQIMTDRLRLETIESILKGATKTIVNSSGLLPHFSVNSK
jgi:membrane protease subunit HflK